MTTTAPGPATTRTSGAARPARSLSLGYLLVLSVLVAVAAVYGLVTDDAYRLVRPLTRATWRAQDAVTLVTLPLLVVAGRRAAAGSFRAHVTVVGILTWLTYCYAHLAIGAPFNPMFMVYVVVLAMAGFAMLDGLVGVDVRSVAPAFAAAPYRAASWFLAVAGVGIAGLWLSDIVPGTFGVAPRELGLAELPNPTWVLDLAWIIPLSFAAAWMTRRRHPAAPLVAGSLLVMLLIVSASMLIIAPFALAAGLGSDPAVRAQLVAFSVVFSVLGGLEGWLLVTARRRMGRVGAWRTSGWWTNREGEGDRRSGS